MLEIKKIIKFFEENRQSGQSMALATIIGIEGSSYRRIGARMIISSSGEWIGGISGGCLEGDLLKQAHKAIFNNKPTIVTYDTREEDSREIGIGLGCQGRIDVLIRPIDQDKKDNEISILKNLVHIRDSKILVHYIDPGSINFGKLELLKDSSEINGDDLNQIQNLVTMESSAIRSSTNKSSGENEKVLLELMRPSLKLVIIGDNYDVKSLYDQASLLDWNVEIMGKPQKLMRYFGKQMADLSLKQGLEEINIDAYSAVILMNHDLKKDTEAFTSLLEKDIKYLGLLGPKKRSLKIFDKLKLKESDSRLGKVFNPVGLELGANDPETIAVSICSEIIAVFNGKNGTSLKFKSLPIYT